MFVVSSLHPLIEVESLRRPLMEMLMNKDQREIQRKLRILRYAEEIGHVAKACRYFGIGRASFYRWRKAYAEKMA